MHFSNSNWVFEQLFVDWVILCLSVLLLQFTNIDREGDWEYQGNPKPMGMDSYCYYYSVTCGYADSIFVCENFQNYIFFFNSNNKKKPVRSKTIKIFEENRTPKSF